MSEREKIRVSPEAHPAEPRSPVLRVAAKRAGAKPNSIVGLQQSAGNQAMLGLLSSGAIQAKLRVSQPGDADELEADRVADRIVTSTDQPTIHRKCKCEGGGASCPACEEEEVEEAKGIHRKAKPASSDSAAVRADFLPSSSPGQPLDSSIRSSMEPHFGRDFGDVRIHADAEADEAARQIDAVAFTHGSDIYFGKGIYNPTSGDGRRVLAHELTHVVQQGRRGNLSPGPSRRTTVTDGPSQNAAICTESSANSQLVMRLTPAAFQKQLGATADQKTAIATLFANQTFLSLWNYLKNCTLADQKDLGPLGLKVTPGLKIGGVERFGGYDHLARTLEINPTKAEHKANPSELVDTITHELMHAVDDLADDCKRAGAGTAPLQGAATATAPHLSTVKGTPQEQQLMQDQGPGASNPCNEFLDINKAAQQIVIQIIRQNIKVAKVGRPTVIFVNEILRQDPKAMQAYIQCRDAACAKSKPEDRQKEMAACSADILNRFMPKSLAP